MELARSVLCLAFEAEMARFEASEFSRGFAHNMRGAFARASSLSQILAIGQAPERSDVAQCIVDTLAPLDGLFRDASAYIAAGLAQPASAEPVPLDSIFDDVRYQSKQRIENNARITFQSNDLCTRFPPGALADALCRLLDNALKFAGPEPTVRIWAERGRNGAVELFVADNGPGIEPRYARMLMLPFRRLHGASVPGQGLGLATARRDIESGGGKIWIAPSTEGALIRISLPL